MKLTFSHTIARQANRGWALLAVLTITGAAVMLVASVISWSNENSAVASRRNEYFSTSYAAEAATEKARSAMMQDNVNYGEGYVVSHLSSYASLLPTSSDDPYFANFSFSGDEPQHHDRQHGQFQHGDQRRSLHRDDFAGLYLRNNRQRGEHDDHDQTAKHGRAKDRVYSDSHVPICHLLHERYGSVPEGPI